MADQKLSQLTVITALANSDLIYVVDGASKGITWQSLKALIDALVTANTAVAANTSKTTNATHTLEVTGSGALTVQPILITNKTAVTPVSGDFILISDTSDSGNFKKVDISAFLGGGGDMLAATYDPTNVSGDAFSMDNMVETATKKVLTNLERTNLSNQSGTNTGDQDISGIGTNASDITTLQTNKEDKSNKGIASGYASLDGGGKVPVSELPSSVIGGIKVIGSWNANTNTPNLSLLSLNAGEAYIVSVAGSTNLNGETNWKVKDLAVWDDSLAGNWFKMDNTDDVISVSGKTGVVVLDTDDVAEATNQYYTEGRVSANSSVTANTAKTTNATHTSEVTGSTALTIAPIAITNKTTVTPVTGDFVLISDTSDSGNLKKVNASDFLGAGSGTTKTQVITWAGNVDLTTINTWVGIADQTSFNQGICSDVMVTGAPSTTSCVDTSGALQQAGWWFKESATVQTITVSVITRHSNTNWFFGIEKRVHTLNASGTSTSFVATEAFRSGQITATTSNTNGVQSFSVNISVVANTELLFRFSCPARSATNLFTTLINGFID